MSTTRSVPTSMAARSAELVEYESCSVRRMLELYYAGNSVEMIARVMGMSPGKTFYLLRDNGCSFRSRGHAKGHEVSEKTRSKFRISMKGREFSDEWRQNIASARTCDYNGMNGYGHKKKHNAGYVLVYAPKHPHAHRDGYIMEHTVIMERHIGRYLRANECVHHKNRNRADNRIENLELMDKHEHHVMHGKEIRGGMTYQ